MALTVTKYPDVVLEMWTWTYYFIIELDARECLQVFGSFEVLQEGSIEQVVFLVWSRILKSSACFHWGLL